MFISAHGSKSQVHCNGKSEQWLQTATHITSTVKSWEQWIHSCSLACLCSVSLTQFRRLCLRSGATHSGPCLPTSINLIKTTDIPRGQAGIDVTLPCPPEPRHHYHFPALDASYPPCYLLSILAARMNFSVSWGSCHSCVLHQCKSQSSWSDPSRPTYCNFSSPLFLWPELLPFSISHPRLSPSQLYSSADFQGILQAQWEHAFSLWAIHLMLSFPQVSASAGLIREAITAQPLIASQIPTPPKHYTPWTLCFKYPQNKASKTKYWSIRRAGTLLNKVCLFLLPWWTQRSPSHPSSFTYMHAQACVCPCTCIFHLL